MNTAGFSNKNEMVYSRKTAMNLGALFITIMVSWSMGYWLISNIFNAPDCLDHVYRRRNLLFLGVLFELIDIGAVLGMTVVMFPLLRRYNERMAQWYFGFRIMECILLVIAILCALAMISLSKDFLAAGNSDTSSFQVLSGIFLKIRNKWVNLILPFFYSLAKIVFFYYFYQLKLIPRPISVFGLIGALLVMAGIPLDFIEFKPGAFIGAVMGITELFLGVWLLVKGFRTPEGKRFY